MTNEKQQVTCGKKNGARISPREAPLFLPQNRSHPLIHQLFQAINKSIVVVGRWD